MRKGMMIEGYRSIRHIPDGVVLRVTSKEAEKLVKKSVFEYVSDELENQIREQLKTVELPNFSYVHCYNQETHKREHFEVPYDVYVYIRQLENKIRYPDESGLFNLYPELEKNWGEDND